MTKKFLFASVLASMLFAGCSKDDVLPNGENDGGEGSISYLAVNLVSSDSGTRASDGYEDGTEAESEVSKVRFYFFTENGEPANVKIEGSSYVNYYDWTPGEGDVKPGTPDNVTKKLGAVLVINTKEGDKIPQMVAAVVNPADKLFKGSMSLAQLKEITNDYTKLVVDDGKFVMFNSVYGKNGAEVCAVPIEAKHLAKTQEAAKDVPVIIYIERSVAKVNVQFGNQLGIKDIDSDKIALKDKEGNPIKVDGQQIYLMLQGWSLTADTDNGRLVKFINPKWESSWWNLPERFRSSWAKNSSTAKNRYNDFNSIASGFGTDHPLYTNENAAKFSEDTNVAQNHTKVIIKGKLCKEDGSPLTLVRHLGVYFADTYSATETDNMPALKNSILAQLKAGGFNYYYEYETADKKKARKQIDASDLQIVVNGQAEKENSKQNCYVVANLTTEAAAKKWYASDAQDAPEVSVETINGVLANKEKVDWALVWKSGQTYYYFEIIHENSGDTPTYGVVRNHVYKAKVTKIAGLGTPVYDPGIKIYPEKPDANDHYIAAEIDILSWRIVENDYELEW